MKEHKCDICGKKLFKKLKSHGYVLCNKHYKQLKKYGKFLDSNPRTLLDRNEYHIEGDITYIDIYNARSEVIAQAVIDTEDLNKVMYTKWKLSSSGYAMNSPKFSGSTKHMSRVILGTDQFVDHINHNTLDNRKCNLRIVTRSQNQMDSNSKGVSKRKDGKYYAYIRIYQRMIDLGVYVFEEEAYFARWYAETILFGKYMYPKEKPFILEERENQIMAYVSERLQRLPNSMLPNQKKMDAEHKV